MDLGLLTQVPHADRLCVCVCVCVCVCPAKGLSECGGVSLVALLEKKIIARETFKHLS